MNVKDFGEAVWDIEGIRIRIFAAEDSEVGDYDLQKAAQGNRNITWFLNTRIRPRVGVHKVDVIGGDGEVVYGGTNIQTVRDSYS